MSNHPIYTSICRYLFMLFLICSVPMVGSSQPVKISLPTSSPQIQATRLSTSPVIDGTVSFKNKPAWVPVATSPRKGDSAAIALWYKIGWNREGLYVAAVVPDAKLSHLLNVGGGIPDAPFILNMTLDVQPKPMAGAPGVYRLQFIPLSQVPSKMIYESQAFKFNHHLGSGSHLNDPGLVVWHELSLSHIQPEGIQTRWAKRNDPHRGGLSFEAFIPWENINLEKNPLKRDIYFDLELNLPGQATTSWIGDMHTARATGGEIKLLKAGQNTSEKLYDSHSLVMKTSSNVVVPQHPLTVVWPVKRTSSDHIVFSLVDKDGHLIEGLKVEASSQAGVLRKELIIPDIQDGVYYLQIKNDQSDDLISQRPLYVAGSLIDQRIYDRRKQLEHKLKNLKDTVGEAWGKGYVAKAKWLLQQAGIASPLSVEQVNQSIKQLDNVEKIIAALEQGKRPAPVNIDYYRPGGFVATGQRGPITFVATSGKAQLIIDADETPRWQVSPLIYGTFSEPVMYDRPIYDFLYAQVLRNTSFEWGHPTFEETINQYVNVYHEIDAASARQVRGEKWVPIQSTDENEVAAPWIGIGTGGPDFSLHREAFNSKVSQKIAIYEEDTEAGVAQLISLPIWRETTYKFKGYFRSDQPLQNVTIKLYYKGKVIDQTNFSEVTDQWQAFETTLTTPKKQKLQNGFLLAITFDGPGSLYVDQVTLFPADAVYGMDPVIVDRLKRMKPAWIRWPGGNYSSGYHWKEGVGPLRNRKASPNPSWPGLPSHFFGTDEYMRLTELINLEPFITVNAGNGTPQEAADWVEYTNGSQNTPMGAWRAKNGHPEPYNVKYWNIGNEIWGSWQKGYCTAAEYANRFRAFTNAMSQRDSSLVFIAEGVGPFSGPKGWNEILLDSLGDHLDVIDFHSYMGVQNTTKLDEDVRVLQLLTGMSTAYEQGLMAFHKKAIEKGWKDLKVIVGEYSTSVGKVSPEWRSVAKLLTFAGWLHTFIRQGSYVIGANATEYSIFDPRAKIKGTLHPRNKLFKLYHHKAGSQPVRAVLKTSVRQSPHKSKRMLTGSSVTPIFNLPVIDAVVLKNKKDGSLSIGLINRDLQNSRQIEIDLNNYQVKKEATQYLLGDDVGPEKPDHPIEIHKKTINAGQHFTVTLPPHSVSLLKIYSN